MKMQIRLLIALFFVTQFLNAQNTMVQTIKGVVTDECIDLPLIGASVIVQGSNPTLGTVTGINGEFILENAPIGKTAIEVSYVGYEPLVITNLELTSAKETVLSIRLREKIYQAEEVVVYANSKDKSNNELAYASARSFTIEETQRYAGTLADPSRMAGNYAGVVSANDNRNDIIIRGNSPMGLLWRLEGIDIPNPNHFNVMGTTGGPLSILNNNVLAYSDFITGAFPAEYGNATSGVFDLKLRNGNNQKREYSIQMGYSGYEAMAEGPFSSKSKASYLVSARYSQQDLMDKIGILPDEVPAIPNYKDITLKMNFPLPKGRISLFGIGGLSDISYIEEELEEDLRLHNSYLCDQFMESGLGMAGASFVHFFNTKTSAHLNVSVSSASSAMKTDSTCLRNDDKHMVRDNNSNETKYTFRTDVKHKFNSASFLKAGLNLNLYQISYTDSILNNSGDYSILNQIQDEMLLLEAFLQYEKELNDKLSTTAGIHLQHLSLNNALAAEPRLAIRYRINPKHTVNLAYGLHSQIQARSVYFLETSIDGEIIKTNKDLGFTKTHHIVTGYDNNITNNLRFKLEAYYQYLFDVPVSTREPGFSMINAGADFELPLKPYLVNEGTGKNYGIECTLEHFFTKNFYFLSTASLFNTNYKGYDKVQRDTEFNSNFVVNILGGYDFCIGDYSKLMVNMRVTCAGGKRYLPVLQEESVETGYIIYDWENAYKKRRDNYFRTDVTFRYRINCTRTSHEIGLELQNLTNHQNEFMEYFDIGSGTTKTEYQTGFFFMPTYKLYF